MPSRTIIVIGAGAAGLLAAGHAVEPGDPQASTRSGVPKTAPHPGGRVLLLERMERPGRKLLISGKGRCNLTNIAPLPEFLGHFGDGARLLKAAFAAFFSDELTALLGRLGIATVTERGGRVFPESGQASDIVDALVRWNIAAGVEIRTRVRVEELLVRDGRCAGVRAGGEDIPGDAVIVATGGASYPATGSSGDGYRLAEAAGHTIVPIRPALVPLVTDGDTAKRLQGLSLKNVRPSLWVDGRKRAGEFGEMLFTHFGVSGPAVLTLSGPAVDALATGGRVELSIDLKPALDDRKLDARLLRDFQQHGKRRFAAILKELLPASLIPVCIDLTGIPGERDASHVTADERRRLRLWLKDFRLTVTGHRGFKEAIVTAGGVARQEVDPRTMESRRLPGLYFAGEVLDIAADTGGYNLQAAFSTGWLAGEKAGKQAGGRRL